MKRLAPILLAEDNANDVELSMAAFREYQLSDRVEVVRDGSQAIDYLTRRGEYKTRKNIKPAVVLLDIKMPRISGIEVLKTIREKEELKDIPVVMLTSSNLQSDIQKCYELGANAYVVKPVDFSEFMEAIKNIGILWAVLNKRPY